MFDIIDCLCELLKCMDGTGGRTKKKKKKKSHVETLTSCISFTHSWACFAEYGTEISSDVNDGCPSAGRTSEPPFRGLATSVWNGLHLQSGGLNHSHCDTGYIEKTLRAESLSCQRNDMSERRKYFTGTNEKKGWGGTSGICCLMRPSGPPTDSTPSLCSAQYPLISLVFTM